MSMMIQIQQISIFLIVASLLIVISQSQPLNQNQHIALMQVYDDLGEFLVWSLVPHPFFIFLLPDKVATTLCVLDLGYRRVVPDQ
jgi:hypothetical protein